MTLTARLNVCSLPVIGLFALMLCCAHTGAFGKSAFTEEYALLKECSPGFQVDIPPCLEEALRRSQARLHQAHAILKNALKTNWEDAKYREHAVQNLAAADRAWARYRQAQCDLSLAMGGGGINRQNGWTACMAASNNLRAAQLDLLSNDINRRRLP